MLSQEVYPDMLICYQGRRINRKLFVLIDRMEESICQNGLNLLQKLLMRH